MKALYKPAAAPASSSSSGPNPRPARPRSRSGCCAPASAAPTCTSRPGTPGPQSAVDAPLIPGHEFCGEVVGRRRRRPRRPGRRPGLRRGPHRLRHLPQLPGRPAPDVHPDLGDRRQPRRRVRRVRRAPGEQRLGAPQPTSTPTSARSSTRSATRCTPRCRFPLVGEDVLITGAGPIGLMAARGRPARRRPVRGGHRRQSPYRLELARPMGVDLALDVEHRAGRRGPAPSWACARGSTSRWR